MSILSISQRLPCTPLLRVRMQLHLVFIWNFLGHVSAHRRCLSESYPSIWWTLLPSNFSNTRLYISLCNWLYVFLSRDWNRKRIVFFHQTQILEKRAGTKLLHLICEMTQICSHFLMFMYILNEYYIVLITVHYRLRYSYSLSRAWVVTSAIPAMLIFSPATMLSSEFFLDTYTTLS